MPTLLTAFGPFPGMPVNPSELLLRSFASEGFTTQLLETSYASAGDTLIEAIERHHPTLLIMLGVRSKSPSIALERFALNNDDSPTPDAAGIIRENQTIHAGAPSSHQTSFDLAALHTALALSEIPIEISNHAGTYLCNHAYFRALHHIHTRSLHTRALFVHIPLILEPLDPLERTIRQLIHESLACIM